MLGPGVIFKIIVLFISFNLTRSAFDCESSEVIKVSSALRPQPEHSCQLSPVTETLHLGDKFVGAENVVRIEPSSKNVKRCLGNCGQKYNSYCVGVVSIVRNESVLVEYSDGVCDTAWAQVTEDVQCACACQSLACPGLARVDNDTCTCVCAGETRDNTTCTESQTFSAHSCSCECEVVEADCPPPLFWSPDLCSCSIILTPEVILSLVIALLVILTLALIYCNIKYHIKVAYLQDQLDINSGGRMSLRQLQQLVSIKPAHSKGSPRLSRNAYSGIVSGHNK